MNLTRDDTVMNRRPAKRARLEDGRGHTFGETNINGMAPVHMGDNVYLSHETANDEETLIKSLLFDRIDTRMHSVKRALFNTCEWLFKHPDFKEWYAACDLRKHNGFLWIKGKPGCGKSTLMKHALEWTRRRASKQKPKQLLLQYFFNARAPSSLEKSSLGMYRSITNQLLSVPALQSLFVAKFALKGSDEWNVAELQDFWYDIVQSEEPLNLCMFIDALDEGEYQDDVRQMINFLVDLSERALESKCQLRICLSSRHYPHISIKKGLELIVEKQIEHAHDIDLYIHEKLLGSDGVDRNELIDEMRRKSANVFLWVVLVVDMLNKIDDQGALLADMKKVLDTIPTDLNQLFTEIITKNTNGIETSIALLQWVLFAMRSLEPNELYSAVKYSASPWNSEWVVPSSELLVPPSDRLAKYLLDCSRGLVEVTTTDPPTVQFIHETVREFLKGDKGLSSLIPALANNLDGLSYEILKVGCLRCVCSSEVSQKFIHLNAALNTMEKEKLCKNMPFLDYAISYMYSHAEAAEACNLSQAAFLNDRLADPRVWRDHERLWWNVFQKYSSQMHKENVTLLYFFADQGYNSLLSALLSVSTAEVNETCGRYGTALQAACVRGNRQAVLSLIAKGADVNMRGGEHKIALAAAIVRKNYDMVPLLEQHGASLELEELRYCFDRAVARSDIEGMDFVVKAGYDTKSSTKKLASALTELSTKRNPNFETIRKLLNFGADINAQGGRYGNALQAASWSGHLELVKLLLDHGADVNAQGGPHGNALQAASSDGHLELVKLLLDHGADVNAQGGPYGNALQAASWSGHLELVKLLLDHGADVNAQGGPYGNALQVASWFGHLELVKLLLDHGADVNAQGGEYGNALQAASWRGHPELVKLLLDHGADVNAQGGHYGNALQAASWRGHPELVKLLLDHGADVNAQGGPHGNALQAASWSGHLELVKLLLDHGADVNAQGGPYGNALQVASWFGHLELVKLLLDHGADVNAQGGPHGNALQAASYFNYKDIVLLLLAHGARE